MLSTHNNIVNMVKGHSTCSKVKRRALPASRVPGVHVLRCHQQPHLGEGGYYHLGENHCVALYGCIAWMGSGTKAARNAKYVQRMPV